MLGVFWHPATDCFKFHVKFKNVNEVKDIRRPTNWELLSVVMSIIDQLEFPAHIIIDAKLLMSEVWQDKTSWYEPMCDAIADSWQIVLFYVRNGKPEKLKLHVFADASENAFVSIAYWRAKIQSLTGPRQELQAVVLNS